MTDSDAPCTSPAYPHGIYEGWHIYIFRANEGWFDASKYAWRVSREPLDLHKYLPWVGPGTGASSDPNAVWGHASTKRGAKRLARRAVKRQTIPVPGRRSDLVYEEVLHD